MTLNLARTSVAKIQASVPYGANLCCNIIRTSSTTSASVHGEGATLGAMVLAPLVRLCATQCQETDTYIVLLVRLAGRTTPRVKKLSPTTDRLRQKSTDVGKF